MLTRLLHSLLMIASTTELVSVTSKSIYHRQLALLKLAIRTSKTILLNITNTFTTQQIKLHLMFLSRNSLCSKLMLKPNVNTNHSLFFNHFQNPKLVFFYLSQQNRLKKFKKLITYLIEKGGI